MSSLGDRVAGDIVYDHFCTVTTTGVPTALASGVLSVYKDGSAVQSTTGVFLWADCDSVTGFNTVHVDTSKDGSFYSCGSDFDVVVTTGTVGGASVVGYCVTHFSLGKTSALRATAANRTLDVSATGEAGLDFDNIKDATGAHTLTNITVPVTTAVTNAVTLTAGERNSVADALLDRADAIETGWTMRMICRILAAALGGKVSGADVNLPVFRNVIDTKNRISATTDVNGNRTVVTLDGA